MRRCHLLRSKLLAGAVRSTRISRNRCADTDNPPTVNRAEMRGHLFPSGEDPIMDSLDAAASLPPR